MQSRWRREVCEGEKRKKTKKKVIRFLGLLLLSGILTGDGTQVDAEYALQVLIREVKQKAKQNKKKIIIMIMQKDEAERKKTLMNSQMMPSGQSSPCWKCFQHRATLPEMMFLCLWSRFFIASVNIIIGDHSWEPVFVPHMLSWLSSNQGSQIAHSQSISTNFSSALGKLWVEAMQLLEYKNNLCQRSQWSTCTSKCRSEIYLWDLNDYM